MFTHNHCACAAISKGTHESAQNHTPPPQPQLEGPSLRSMLCCQSMLRVLPVLLLLLRANAGSYVNAQVPGNNSKVLTDRSLWAPSVASIATIERRAASEETAEATAEETAEEVATQSKAAALQTSQPTTSATETIQQDSQLPHSITTTSQDTYDPYYRTTSQQSPFFEPPKPAAPPEGAVQEQPVTWESPPETTLPPQSTTPLQWASSLSPRSQGWQSDAICAASCLVSCGVCDSKCLGCDFCKQELNGPLGESAKYCFPTMQAFTDAGRTTLFWIAPPEEGEEKFPSPFGPAMEIDVDCKVLCYEVWYSDTPDFSSFQVQSVSGQTEVPLPDLGSEGLGPSYAKVRAVQSAEVTSYASRSAWSNMVDWRMKDNAGSSVTIDVSSSAEAAEAAAARAAGTQISDIAELTTRLPHTTTLPETSPASTLSATTTYIFAIVPPNIATTMVPMWQVPASVLSGQQRHGISGQDASDGIEASLEIQVAPGDVSSLVSERGIQTLRSGISSMLLVRAERVQILSVSAASTALSDPTGPPRSLQTQTLRRAAESEGVITGAMQADFVVMCSSVEERRTVTNGVESIGRDADAMNRFTTVIRGAAGVTVDPAYVRGGMLDRYWSRSALVDSIGHSQDGGLEVVSQDTSSDRQDKRKWWQKWQKQKPWLPALVASMSGGVLFACCACAILADRKRRHRRHEAPEKGEAPSGLVGFDPRRFDPGKYMTQVAAREATAGQGDLRPLLSSDKSSGSHSLPAGYPARYLPVGH
ncbi:unnamed protein product [Polarella glacialis]|uniref:Transmembrane protein n=1 Tax=Polarella glacialis TaxID=89957 RepID=A0A813KT44_POLGL|nr:unnamed protein product [Polarella glacialis]